MQVTSTPLPRVYYLADCLAASAEEFAAARAVFDRGVGDLPACHEEVGMPPVSPPWPRRIRGYTDAAGLAELKSL